MSAATDPAPHLFWLASRAVGICALVLLSASVALGLGLSGRTLRGPGRAAQVRRLHEATMLVMLGAVGVHGALLLGDGYLRPGAAGVLLPFAIPHARLWTGLGVLAGWLGLMVWLSTHARRWLGGRTWRRLHRWALAVYALALAHTLGSGSDAGSAWFRLALAALAAPVVFALVVRVLPPAPRRSRAPGARTAQRSRGAARAGA